MSEKIDISIVIPAFNEEKRLPLFLGRVVSYCQRADKICEIIVVDDGSSDNTFEVANSFKAKFGRLHVIKNTQNSGKGHSVKKGFFSAKGDVQVFLDADGSTGPEEIGRNMHYIDEGYDIVVGSRVLTSETQVIKTRWHRRLMGNIFNYFVRTFLFDDIKDTQCGFKMFKKETVEPLFSRIHLRRFGFDIELLYLAHKMGYKIKEEAVSWHHVAGSKVNIFIDSIKMFINVLQVRNWHCTPVNYFSKHMGPDEYRFMCEMEEYHWWFTSRKDLILELIRSLGQAHPKILDLGSGTGVNLAAFKKLGEVSGVDISEQAVAFCQKRGLKNVVLGPVQDLQYEDNTFDIITCLDVLEYVPNPVQALLEMKRVLKGNGRIVITVPAFRILWSQHDEALCHLRRYEKKSFAQDLNEAGLKAEKISYFFLTSFFVVAPIRIIRRFVASKEKIHSDTTTLPPKFLNALLKLLFKIEMKMALQFGLPLGTSLYAIVSKRK